jgi:hypothetical protein
MGCDATEVSDPPVSGSFPRSVGRGGRVGRVGGCYTPFAMLANLV